MELTIREAAPLLGRSARAVRAKIERGELPARRQGRVWLIPLASLPLTATQRASMQRRAEQMHAAVDDATPSRMATTRDRRTRSVGDLHAFAAGTELLREMATDQSAADAEAEVRARDLIHRAMLRLCCGFVEFDAGLRATHLRAARHKLARALGLLLATPQAPSDRVLGWCQRLEHDVIPPIGGLLRWADKSRRSK